MLLKDKTAVVTGGSQGIGKVIAEKLASEGANIVIFDLDVSKGEEVSNYIQNTYSVKSKFYKVNVASKEEVENAIKSAETDISQINILINNAGITRDNLLFKMSEEDWNLVLSVNLTGAFNCVKAVIRKMAKAKFGRIVNISSVVGLIGNVGQTNYSASKAGLIGLTKSVAKEFAAKNVTVNAVAPGFIETAMTDVLPENIKTQLLDKIPLKRLGQPEDIANAVKYLVSEDASYVTGQVISVDGGMT